VKPTQPTRTLNVAHRGASTCAPENSIEAFELAVEQGADGFELDLHRSRDGEVIVLHDSTVDRTTDGRGLARDLDLAELKQLDAGYHHVGPRGDLDWRGRTVRIPTLEDLLRRFPDCWLSLDLKEGDTLTERRTVDLLRQYGRIADVALGAENPAAAQRLRRLAPEIPSFFSRSDVRAFVLRSKLRLWWGYRPPGASLQIPPTARGFALDRDRLLRDAWRVGVRVLYWTINDVDDMRRLVELGADGIITDRPDLLAGLLRERS
jgi:glycerophosphoryl diester phosphodiesterase